MIGENDHNTKASAGAYRATNGHEYHPSSRGTSRLNFHPSRSTWTYDKRIATSKKVSLSVNSSKISNNHSCRNFIGLLYVKNKSIYTSNSELKLSHHPSQKEK